MALTYPANSRYTESGRARHRENRKFEDDAWLHEQIRQTEAEAAAPPVEGVAEEAPVPLSTRMLALYEISWRRVEQAAPTPTGRKLKDVLRAEAVAFIAGSHMYGWEGDEDGLTSLCAAAVYVLVGTAHRSATRHRLAREAVAVMLRLLSVNELAHVLAWRSDFRSSPFYAPHCNRLRELAMLEVTKRASASVIDDREAQLNLPGL